MHRDSRVISKIQPKIRIIHIFAPEIIKTDVANFRELVQRLTGKPSPENDVAGKGKGKGKGKKVKAQQQQQQQNNEGCNKPRINTKLEVMMGSGSSSSPSSSSDHHHHHHHHHHQHHDHQEGWRSTTTAGDHINSSGGYLTGFTDDLDYSFDFNTMFNLGTNDASSHLNTLGETPQLSFRG
ncbi:VQ motif-containing protein 18 [Bienertia sinuspersici]